MHQRTIKEEWDNFTANLKAPQAYLDFAFYGVISAALQRRVWLGPPLEPLVPNLYVILCGDPGIGKGLAIGAAQALLQHHKFKGQGSLDEIRIEKMIKDAQANGASNDTLILLRQSKEALEQVKQLNPKGPIKEEYLFPMGAEATTYEALVEQHGESVRVCHTKPCPMAPSGIYTYHSLCICVEEASSLFRERAETLVQYLLAAYNCKDYKYKTKRSGTDVIKRSSLTLIGGTTPEFMKHAFNDKLLGEGFSSRSMFVYGDKNRFEGYKIKAHTPEQLESRERILVRLKELSMVFGQCELTSGADEFLEHYFTDIHPKRRDSAGPKLKHYFARKDLHTQKLGLCIHFAEEDSFEITERAFIKAIKMLDDGIEETMLNCLSIKSINPVNDIQIDIFRYLGAGPKSFADILAKFFDNGNTIQIMEALSHLETIERIKKDGLNYRKI